MVNIDMLATAFYKSNPLITITCRFFSEGSGEITPLDFTDLRDFQNVLLNKELQGLRVRIAKDSAKQLCFTIEDGSPNRVSRYFEAKYGRSSYPILPCVVSGSATCPVCYPQEMCEIVEGHHCGNKLDENQSSEMIKRTAQPPAMRFNNIRRSVRDLVNSNEPYLREYQDQH